MSHHAHSPNLHTAEETPVRNCSPLKPSYSNRTNVLNDDENSEMQQTSRQSGDLLASLFRPTVRQFLWNFSFDVCVCRRTEEEARKLSAEET